VIGTVSFREPPADSDDDLRPTLICPFSVTLDNRARAAPIRYPGFENIGPNLSGCTNCRPDQTHSVGPRWTGGRPDYWDPWSALLPPSTSPLRDPASTNYSSRHSGEATYPLNGSSWNQLMTCRFAIHFLLTRVPGIFR
jgi:hypothetical protein